MRLIDADALFDNVLEAYGGIIIGEREANLFMKMIIRAPTVNPESLQPQWIPVKEKLPENEGDFIVTANDSITGLFVVKDHCYKGTDGKMQFLNQIDGNLYHNHDGELKRHTRNITAWMPLPEPYKGEHDD